MKKIKKPLLYSLQAIVAIAPIIWIFHKVDFSGIGEVLNQVAWWTLPSLIFIGLIILFLNGVRWYVLLATENKSNLKFSAVMYSHFVGSFYSLVLPSSFSQDVVRTVIISRQHDYSKSWGATWIAKLINLGISALFSLYGFFILDSATIRTIFPFVAISVVLILISLVLSFSKIFTKHLRVQFARFLPQRLVEIFENIRQEIYLFRNKKRNLFWCMVLTFVTQLLVILNGIFLIAGITGRFCIAECFAFIPVIELLTVAVVISFNGIGVREMLSFGMFTYIGFTKEQLGVYIVLGYVSILIKLIGGIPLLVKKVSYKPSNS